MKRTIFKTMIAAAALVSAIQFSSCKGKKDGSNADTTVKVTDTAANTAGPVTIANDDELTTGVKDATKDFEGVQATVANGEVTLTGNIDRDRLPTLMQSLSTLHPKKINNNLTINK